MDGHPIWIKEIADIILGACDVSLLLHCHMIGHLRHIQADLVAVWQLAGAFLAWQAVMAQKLVPAAAQLQPLQTACTLEIGVSCILQQPVIQVSCCDDTHVGGYIPPRQQGKYRVSPQCPQCLCA